MVRLETKKRCMNTACGAAASDGEWLKGWGLRSGGFADLCGKCGLAFEQLLFCDIFHEKESGWRECKFCCKRLHCGCIASNASLDLLDCGGVQCNSCLKNSNISPTPGHVVQCPLPSSLSMLLDYPIRGKKDEKVNDFVMSIAEATSHVGDAGSSHASSKSQIPVVSFHNSRQGDGRLSINMRTSNFGNTLTNCNSGNQPSVLLLPNTATEGREHNKALSAFEQMQMLHHHLGRLPKTSNAVASEVSKDMLPYVHVTRSPSQGQGRNQMLPRYWPRISDIELQQISGDSKSKILPLFEKVLSASDAGRIGRLVLPKACAEAYFPPISQPEGLPLRIQDAKGKDWVFQFRFWPNNNSRMYVLEGVTPCIQSLQLQAGDTVTFNRIDPEGKLVMGFRKAIHNTSLENSQVSAIDHGAIGNEPYSAGVTVNPVNLSGYFGLLPSLTGTTVPQLSTFPEHLSSAGANIGCHKIGTLGQESNESLSLKPSLAQDMKRSLSIGSKGKRLLMDNEYAMELKLTWEEAQDMLRPPPSLKPSIVEIEDHEFEEYKEPPVFGKRTIFTMQASGELDQWVQCDDCLKWHRLPLDVLLSSNWTCADNTWDLKRASCYAPDEVGSRELQNMLQLNAEFYSDLRGSTAGSISENALPELEASGLGDVSTAAVIDDDNVSNCIIATTTRHPRHRPGCTCIVCIQPPSGKGPKHKPTCMCNVCMTVKRRFKTLMMRKKKRQSEYEESVAMKKLAWGCEDEMESDSSLKTRHLQDPAPETELASGSDNSITEKLEMS
ncbi:B3 domain-containing protein Os07g0679700-like [Dioscorea cayenensis subsp. rotundata]|uniref:B3 domain-containing protein Os07g0679700-like n=1 Tax=Dioscorea cayennensis subsp. rotundata TaxID=55577 RepID=A0AB40AHH3_DIOCR|nr:B3 domain-containing protein Os07g0679700-like [Dioscorea cayenensis subsp. rotundata]